MPLSVRPVLCVLLVIGGFTVSKAFCDDKSPGTSPSKVEASPSRIVSQVEVKPKSAPTEQEMHELSLAASRVLKHVTQARNALHHKKLDDAKIQIQQALKLVAMINSLQPRYAVKTEIKAGDHIYRDEEEVVPQYVVLFTDLEYFDVISPVVDAKRQRHAQPHGNADKHENVDSAGAWAIVQEDVRFTTARMNVAFTDQRLHAALKALESGKPQNADEALADLQANAVILELVEADVPLKEAVDYLRIAELQAKAGHIHKAKSALQQASEKLKAYEGTFGIAGSTEVKAMQTEIQRVSAELEKAAASEAERHKLAAAISDCWRKVTGWFSTVKH